MPKHIIDSLKSLHQHLPEILKKINADPQLAIAAAANLLYAVEELGFQIDPKVRSELEDNLRFKPKTITRLKQLRQEIFKQTNRQFDLNSQEELHKVLYVDLKLPAEGLKTGKKERLAHLAETAPLPPQVGWAPKVADPLAKLQGKHPVMEALLEYRRLEASEPRLASQEVYQDLRRGKRTSAVSRVRFVLKNAPP